MICHTGTVLDSVDLVGIGMIYQTELYGYRYIYTSQSVSGESYCSDTKRVQEPEKKRTAKSKDTRENSKQ